MSSMSSYIDLSESQFKAIAESNVLRKSWYEKLGCKTIKYMDFVAALAKDPESLLLSADESARESFYQDLPKMLIPLVYEDVIITGCERLVLKILNKLGVSQNDSDDALNIGRMAVRNSIWHYTNTDVAFVSYAYRSVHNRVLDYEVDVVQKENDSPVTAVSMFKDSTSMEEVYKRMKGVCTQSSEITLLVSKETGENVKIRDIMYEAAKDEIDHKLIDCYFAQGARWGQVFRAQVLNPVTKKPFSKAGIYRRFNTLIKRVKDTVHTRVSVYHVEQ